MTGSKLLRRFMHLFGGSRQPERMARSSEVPRYFETYSPAAARNQDARRPRHVR